jgi:hypothetical protein
MREYRTAIMLTIWWKVICIIRTTGIATNHGKIELAA